MAERLLRSLRLEMYVWRDFMREDGITDWREQVVRAEARYDMKLDGVRLASWRKDCHRKSAERHSEEQSNGPG